MTQESETCYDQLADGRTLVFERHWTEEVRDGARLAEYVTKGRVDKKQVTDAELVELLADLDRRRQA